MSTAVKILNSKPVVMAAGVAVGAVVLYFIAREIFDEAGKAADDFNRGTAYASDKAGAVGTAVRTLGNVANQASGGILGDFGGWLGGAIYDLTHAAYDPNK